MWPRPTTPIVVFAVIPGVLSVGACFADHSRAAVPPRHRRKQDSSLPSRWYARLTPASMRRTPLCEIVTGSSQRKKRRSLMAVRENTKSDGAVKAPEPIEGDLGATILGPRNEAIERLNPDVLISPVTDAGTIPNLKWPFAMSRNRVLSGGWARETTVRELPVSTEISGVDMRLKPGAMRELHWHKEA